MAIMHVRTAAAGCCAWILLVSAAPAGPAASASRIDLVNNQPFEILEPVQIHGVALTGGPWTAGREPVQIVDGDAVLIASVPSLSSRRLDLRRGVTPQTLPVLRLSPDAEGVALTYQGRPTGRLTWDIVRQPQKSPVSDVDSTPRPDFQSLFRALPLAFRRTAAGPVFDRWSGRAERDGLTLAIDLRAYHAGFLDIAAHFSNRAVAQTSDMYAAVVCRWEEQDVSARSVCYDGRTTPFSNDAWTPFRRGKGRHWFVQRGVDWMKWNGPGGTSAVWLNDFTPSFTVHREKTARRPGGYVTANTPQLGQEAQCSAHTLFSITEIARSTIRSYRDRTADNVLMPIGASLSFSSRVAMLPRPVADSRADEMFLASVGHIEQKSAPNGRQVTFGVKGVEFGTAYFPYSTLGENFGTLKLPGMDREAYWPLAADTVTHWKLFADDIRRDLRMASAMGFSRIRLHHLELITPLSGTVRQEYLDFLFGEMRHLGLRALLDVQMPAEEVGALVRRYHDALCGVEIENEVLIYGIPDGRIPYWNAVYDAVKQADPAMPVHLTGQTNTGIFDRLAMLGGKTDKISGHSYIDALDALPSGRGWALALANYAAKSGKPATITEWNWRGLTRMTPEARAKVYPPIFENVLATRSIPEIYQFQLQESLAMNPGTLKGIRHYELLWLSRRLKPEAIELMRLIEKYSLPSAPVRLLRISRPTQDLDAAGRTDLTFRVENTSARPLVLRSSLEAPVGVEAAVRSDRPITLPAGAHIDVPVHVTAAQRQPGFYQIFLRLEDGHGLLRYGWAEVRAPGAPTLDTTPHAGVRSDGDALHFDFNRRLTVVYGDNASVLEVECASVLANTLECVTGRAVTMLALGDLPADERRSGALVLVGTASSHALIGSAAANLQREGGPSLFRVAGAVEHGDWLVVGGKTAEEVEAAAMDLTLRYWKTAKDSAARRIGLIARELPTGGDPNALP